MPGARLGRAEETLRRGLTIVKRLVELHGGRVEAHSAGSGKGSTFVVRLPAAAAPNEAREATTPTGVAIPSLRILIVDDNRDGAEGLMMLLQHRGHRVDVAYDGRSALEAARSSPPDVMLVDIGLPGMDGYEVARRLRGEGTLRNLCLVAITGYTSAEDRRRALAAGFDHHVSKPVRIETLEGILASSRGPRSTSA